MVCVQIDTWKYLNVISQIIQEGVILPNGCWYTRQYSECDQSDYTRGDNRGRADLQRGGQAGVSRLKFPLKDREPRWQGSTTFSDSCLFMISNLVNPLFHCNSQYSWWYKGLKAIGVTGRRKMDKDISGALISVQCLQPDVSKWPQKRLSLWDLPVKVVLHLFWFLCPDIWYKETQRVMNMVPGHKTWWWGASRDVTKWPQDWLRPANHWSIIEPGGVTQIWSKSSPHSKTLHTHQWKF